MNIKRTLIQENVNRDLSDKIFDGEGPRVAGSLKNRLLSNFVFNGPGRRYAKGMLELLAEDRVRRLGLLVVADGCASVVAVASWSTIQYTYSISKGLRKRMATSCDSGRSEAARV